MKRKRRYDEDMPSDRARIIEDFLPPPEKLVLPNDHVKITIRLDVPSVEYFKKHAKQIGVKYQRMIRQVLLDYAKHHSAKHAA
jgi:predicted DNA binding CopG/RHH family protein